MATISLDRLTDVGTVCTSSIELLDLESAAQMILLVAVAYVNVFSGLAATTP